VRSLYPQEAKRPQKKEKAFPPPSAETRRPLTNTLLRIEVLYRPTTLSRSFTDIAARAAAHHSGTLAQSKVPLPGYWHDEDLHNWPGRTHVETLRLWPELERTVQRVESLPECYSGLLLIGSRSRGEGDAISDVDLVAVAHEGGWQAAWDARHRLSSGALVTFDRFGPRPAVAGHIWLTQALVKVECLIAEPVAGGMRLRGDAAVLLGSAEVLDKFERKPAHTRQEIDAYVAELREQHNISEIESAYGHLITLLQREIRTTTD
jgi:hypothetical protein